MSDFYNNKFNWVLFFTIAVLVLLAWSNRFIQDDAFISFRYSDNFVNGHGFVWNVGGKIEGYTNFLWVLAMTIPLYLKLDPVTFSFALGIACFVVSLIFTYKTATLICGSKDIGLLTIILLGANYTFSSYATGGLETQLQACLFVSSMFILLRSIHTHEWKIQTMTLLSFLLSAALLTRLDSGLLAAVIIPIAIFAIFQEGLPSSRKLVKIIALGLPLLLLVGSWLLWKLMFYGDILPNSYYIKAASKTSPLRGVYFVYLFWFSYWLIPFPFLCASAGKKLFNKSNVGLVAFVVLILLWSSYIIKVGGDFMEFRFMVPILPLLFIIIAWIVFVLIQQKQIRNALILLIVIGSLHHKVSFGMSTKPYQINSINQLQTYVKNDDQNWEGIGKVLGKGFNYDHNIIMATGAAGAIPFYSRLTSIDMWGLNDKWVTEHGYIMGTTPGHQRLAKFSYLLKRKVNLLVGHPWMISKADTTDTRYPINDVLRRFLLKSRVKPEEVPLESKIIEIPIDQNYTLVVFYIFKSKAVDEAIQRNAWKVYPILR